MPYPDLPSFVKDLIVKKNDLIDARKQGMLLSMNELPRMHMPHEGVGV